MQWWHACRWGPRGAQCNALLTMRTCTLLTRGLQARVERMLRSSCSACAGGISALLCALLALAPRAHALDACLDDGTPCTADSNCCGDCSRDECPADVARDECPMLCRDPDDAADAAAYEESYGADEIDEEQVDADDDPAEAGCRELSNVCEECADCCDGLVCKSGMCAQAPLWQHLKRKSVSRRGFKQRAKCQKGSVTSTGFVTNSPTTVTSAAFNQASPCRGNRKQGWRCLSRRGKRLLCKAHLRCAWWRNKKGERVPICRKPPHKPIYLCASPIHEPRCTHSGDASVLLLCLCCVNLCAVWVTCLCIGAPLRVAQQF